MNSTGAMVDSRQVCHCGSAECQPKILQSILSFKYSGSGNKCVGEETKCRRSAYSPSGSTGSCYNSPRQSPSSSPNPAAACSPSPPSTNQHNSKLYLLLNGQTPSRKSPAPHTGAALEPYPRVIPSPGAASTCSSAASEVAFGYQSSQQEFDQEEPLNLKRSFQQTYSATTNGCSIATTVHLSQPQDATADQPMDLSCKKRRLSVSSAGSEETGFSAFIKREVVTPEQTDFSSNDGHNSILRSILCGQHHRSSGQASPANYSLPPSPLSQHSTASPRRDSNTSTSSSILCGILNQSRLGMVTTGSQPGSRCSTPGSVGAPSLSGSQSSSRVLARNKQTAVTLAKKNLFPVTARVSEWLVKIVEFAKEQEHFGDLPYTDQVGIILHSWARLLLLHMAETSFEFAVTPKNSCGEQSGSDDDEPRRPDPDVPTMRDVEGIQRLISKCQSLGLDQQEYDYLKLIILFNQGTHRFVMFSCRGRCLGVIYLPSPPPPPPPH